MDATRFQLGWRLGDAERGVPSSFAQGWAENVRTPALDHANVAPLGKP